MNINQATDYAFRAILFLANQPPDSVVDAQRIAEQQVIPMRFLLKTMPALIKAGIIKSQRGVGGGYALAKPAQKISFLEVIEALEGPIHLNKCLQDTELCSRHEAPQCPIHQRLEQVQEVLVKALTNHNFGELIEDK